MTQSLVDVAKMLAREAGDLIALRRESTVEVANTKSSTVDIVTEVDREAEALLFSRLVELRPGDGFLGEEGKTAESTTGITWVVDPIDGTVNFFYNIPHYAVSIAAVSGPALPGQWQVEAGAVYNPATREMFWAERGNGSYLGDRKLQIHSPPPLDLALLGTGFAYSAAMRKEQSRLMHEILPLIRDLRRMGTASLDLAAVAAGRVDVYFERTLNPWDHAAGELLVTEAGGVIRGIGQQPPGREGIYAGHIELVDQLQSLVSKLKGEKLLADIPGWGLD
jgi:myo-inositol-1(or 4)-monophosphatase